MVSEETGRLSLFCGGEMEADLSGPDLRQQLLRRTGLIREIEEAAAADESGTEGDVMSGLKPRSETT